MQGNFFAFTVLTAWIPFSYWVFRRYPQLQACLICILAGTLFLPSTELDAPLLPPLDRAAIPFLTAYLGARWSGKAWKARALGALPRALFWLTLIGIALNVASNGQAIIMPNKVLPAIQPYEGLSMAFRLFATMLGPFLLGYAVVRRPEDLGVVLAVLVGAALIYSLPIIYEIVMSPRLHKIIYGFRQHSFAQTKRFGGWRPMVFMGHGLEVAMFMTSALLAAAGLARARLGGKLGTGRVVLYLLVVAIACKSMATWFYMTAALPLIWALSSKGQMRVAVVIAWFVLAYPGLRLLDALPTEAFVDQMAELSPERAQSLGFRFDMEDVTIEHANQRFLSGWGRFGRALVYDRRTGEQESVPDGLWLVTYAGRGMLGVIGTFGLLLVPVLIASRRLGRIRVPGHRMCVSVLSLVVTFTALDFLPNGSVNSITFFLPGALLGAVTAVTPSGRRAPPTSAARDAGSTA